jgi:hypothetical protein
MREIRQSGSEGGAAQLNAPFLPPISGVQRRIDGSEVVEPDRVGRTVRGEREIEPKKSGGRSVLRFTSATVLSPPNRWRCRDTAPYHANFHITPTLHPVQGVCHANAGSADHRRSKDSRRNPLRGLERNPRDPG